MHAQNNKRRVWCLFDASFNQSVAHSKDACIWIKWFSHYGVLLIQIKTTHAYFFISKIALDSVMLYVWPYMCFQKRTKKMTRILTMRVCWSRILYMRNLQADSKFSLILTHDWCSCTKSAKACALTRSALSIRIQRMRLFVVILVHFSVGDHYGQYAQKMSYIGYSPSNINIVFISVNL